MNRPIGMFKYDSDTYIVLSNTEDDFLPNHGAYENRTAFLEYCASVPSLNNLTAKHFYTAISSGECTVISATFVTLVSQLMSEYEFHDELTKKRLTGISSRVSSYLGCLEKTHLMYAQSVPDLTGAEDISPTHWDVEHQRDPRKHTVSILEFLGGYQVIFDPSCAQFSFFPDWEETCPQYPYYFSSVSSDQSRILYSVSLAKNPRYNLTDLEAYLSEFKSFQRIDSNSACRVRTIEAYVMMQKCIPLLVTQLLEDNSWTVCVR